MPGARDADLGVTAVPWPGCRASDRAFGFAAMVCPRGAARRDVAVDVFAALGVVFLRRTGLFAELTSRRGPDDTPGRTTLTAEDEVRRAVVDVAFKGFRAVLLLEFRATAAVPDLVPRRCTAERGGGVAVFFLTLGGEAFALDVRGFA